MSVPAVPEAVKMRRIIRSMKRLFPHATMMLNYKSDWELMVAVQLSAQCADKKVNEVTPALFKRYPQLTDYVNARPAELESLIRSIGLYRNKAKNIIQCAREVNERFGGTLPRTVAELCTLPGVGRKTANVVLGNAYHISEGIAVDTHVKRLAEKFGLTRETDPVRIERDLMLITPRKEWFMLTYYFIEFGRKYCPARSHDHEQCVKLLRVD